MLFAGVARRDITPPRGTTLVGFLDRAGRSTRAHDALVVTALALGSSAERPTAILVSGDVLAIHCATVAAVRAEISARTGLPPEHIWMSATHTHSGGPTVDTETMRPDDRRYAQRFRDEAIRCAVEAAQVLRPVTVVWRAVRVEVGVNRRNESGMVSDRHRTGDGPVDHLVMTAELRIEESEDPSILATLAVVPCHPVAHGRSNTVASADFLGAARQVVEAEVGGLCVMLYGSGGDVNPLGGSSEEFEPQAGRLGRTLGRAIVDQRPDGAVSPGAGASAGLAVRTGIAEVHIDRRDPSLCDEPAHFLELHQLDGKSWASVTEILDARFPWTPPPDSSRPDTGLLACEVGVIDLGEGVLVSLPFEVFTRVGQRIQAMRSDAIVAVLSLTNGGYGYLPNREEYSRPGYEVEEAPALYRLEGSYSPDSESRILEEVQRLLQESVEATSND